MRRLKWRDDWNERLKQQNLERSKQNDEKYFENCEKTTKNKVRAECEEGS